MRLNPRFDPRHLGLEDAPPPTPPGAPASAPHLRVTHVRPLVHQLRTEAEDLLRYMGGPVRRLRTAAWTRLRSATSRAAGSLLHLLGALWLRFGFAPTGACALALLTYFAASMLGHHAPLKVALATGRWTLVLALAAGMAIMARKQVRRAVRW
jgi:hypothetical protein